MTYVRAHVKSASAASAQGPMIAAREKVPKHTAALIHPMRFPSRRSATPRGESDAPRSLIGVGQDLLDKPNTITANGVAPAGSELDHAILHSAERTVREDGV